jgi:hypothetical protein
MSRSAHGAPVVAQAVHETSPDYCLAACVGRSHGIHPTAADRLVAHVAERITTPASPIPAVRRGRGNRNTEGKSMNHFMVRVSLRPGMRSADEAEHLQLSVAMEAEGFSHLITASGGAAFQLPAGEYYIAGEYTRRDVLVRAKSCAAATGRRCAILVTQAEAFLWSGLKKAHAHAGRDGVAAGRPSPPARLAR